MQLLERIEELLGFDGNETTINPDYLAYFTVEELEKMLQELERRHERMVEENLEWLQRFRS